MGGTEGRGREGPVRSVAGAQCPPGSVAYGSSCFRLSGHPRAQAVAQTNCEEQGGSLAEVSDAEDVAWLQDVMLAYGVPGPVWIGIVEKVRFCVSFVLEEVRDGNPEVNSGPVPAGNRKCL